MLLPFSSFISLEPQSMGMYLSHTVSVTFNLQLLLSGTAFTGTLTGMPPPKTPNDSESRYVDNEDQSLYPTLMLEGRPSLEDSPESHA